MKQEQADLDIFQKICREKARKEKCTDGERAEDDEGSDVFDQRLSVQRERHFPEHFVLEGDDMQELPHFVSSRKTDSSFPSYFDL